jgi:hypothetical protein
VASEVSATGVPPETETLKPVVGEVAVISVPAAIGFRRGRSMKFVASVRS